LGTCGRFARWLRLHLILRVRGEAIESPISLLCCSNPVYYSRHELTADETRPAAFTPRLRGTPFIVRTIIHSDSTIRGSTGKRYERKILPTRSRKKMATALG